MDVGCIEIIVSRQPNNLIKAIKIVLIILAVLLILAGCAASILLLILGLAAAAGAYFVSREEQIDFEYSYVEKELRIAKIMNKERRKEIGRFDLEQMEILAPVNSWKLGDYKNRQIEKDLDYTSKTEENPQNLYYLYLEGKTRLKLELVGEEAGKLLDVLYFIAPRKVFRD